MPVLHYEKLSGLTTDYYIRSPKMFKDPLNEVGRGRKSHFTADSHANPPGLSHQTQYY